MNDTFGRTSEVDAFVAAVRARFSDLDVDEREDLLDGLQADTTELVAERGPEALGDPDVYAAELRAAAGLAPAGAARGYRGIGRKVPPRTPVMVVADARTRFDAEIATRPWAETAMDFFTTIRPAWWVLRAWLLVQVADVLLGPWEELTVLPTLMIPGAGLMLLLFAIIVSVKVGLGAWPNARRVPADHRRVLVLVGNLAVLFVALPLTVSQAQNQTWWADYGYAMASARASGVTNDGRQVCNLQAYDMAGQPLAGVQLFDDRGRSFDVRCADRYGKAAYPWYLGDVPRWNVFPMAERRQRADDRMVEGAYESSRPPAFPVTDRATVPTVTHPLLPAQVVEPLEEENENSTGAKPGDTEPGNTKPGNTEPGNTKPGNTSPGDAQPGNTKPGNTSPGDAQPGARAQRPRRN